jgi:SlyX protein
MHVTSEIFAHPERASIHASVFPSDHHYTRLPVLIAPQEVDMRDEEKLALIERLEVLETKVVFQDRTLDALNGVVAEQYDRIDKLSAQVEKLQEIARSLEPGGVEAGEEPPPPHY